MRLLREGPGGGSFLQSSFCTWAITPGWFPCSRRPCVFLSLLPRPCVTAAFCPLSPPPPQSYGPEHLLTFHNLKRMGLLTEQVPGETLTAVESKVSKLVTDRAAGEEEGGQQKGGREGASHSGSQRGLCQRACSARRCPGGSCSWGGRPTSSPFARLPGKLSDAFSSLARKSNFRAISKKLGLVGTSLGGGA